MKRHCGCGIFKNSDAGLLMQAVQLRDEREREAGMQSHCGDAGSQCAGHSVLQYDHSAWQTQPRSLFLVVLILTCTIGGSLYDYNQLYDVSFSVSLFPPLSPGPAWSRPTFLFSHTFFADPS